MTTTIINPWITLSEKRKGVTVQRKMGGIHAPINVNDEVEFCQIMYWERELYPNGDIIKCEKKSYLISDLAETVTETYRINANPVLTNFLNNLGYPYIINPARLTLADLNVLLIDVPDNYELHSLTGTQILL